MHTPVATADSSLWHFPRSKKPYALPKSSSVAGGRHKTCWKISQEMVLLLLPKIWILKVIMARSFTSPPVDFLEKHRNQFFWEISSAQNYVTPKATTTGDNRRGQLSSWMNEWIKIVMQRFILRWFNRFYGANFMASCDNFAFTFRNGEEKAFDCLTRILSRNRTGLAVYVVVANSTSQWFNLKESNLYSLAATNKAMKHKNLFIFNLFIETI